MAEEVTIGLAPGRPGTEMPYSTSVPMTRRLLMPAPCSRDSVPGESARVCRPGPGADAARRAIVFSRPVRGVRIGGTRIEPSPNVDVSRPVAGIDRAAAPDHLVGGVTVPVRRRRTSAGRGRGGASGTAASRGRRGGRRGAR
ncbi:hypothetical protein Asera_43410 [Actinocatenispora sera]|uniref:Uncharacterized protein n=1 Tax=Actinocatenispora sera TaxID=390989 RepID=A0A810L4D4_9ACTN|nr:hypothetical protein Asera_43410 [Actinocatenispora sera]